MMNTTPTQYKPLLELNETLWSHPGGMEWNDHGLLSPGRMAEEIFGPHLHPENLFLYLFRRFGIPIADHDHRTEIAAYLLTTPREDCFLDVRVKAQGWTANLFGYAIPRAEAEAVRREGIPGGPVTRAVSEALRAALLELNRPVLFGHLYLLPSGPAAPLGLDPDDNLAARAVPYWREG